MFCWSSERLIAIPIRKWQGWDLSPVLLMRAFFVYTLSPILFIFGLVDIQDISFSFYLPLSFPAIEWYGDLGPSSGRWFPFPDVSTPLWSVENGDVSLMAPIRDGWVRKFTSSGKLGLKTPRWSAGRESIKWARVGVIHYWLWSFRWYESSVIRIV